MSGQASLQNEPMPLSEKLSWLALSRAENIGPITFFKLVDKYGSASVALEMLPELARNSNRKKPYIAPPMDAIKKEYEALQKLGGEIITAGEPAYPLALSAIDDPPPVISVLGNQDLMHQSCLAIVGARNASLNGRKFAQKLASDLGEADQVIVSGLARGIDTSAHKGALTSGTIAVVAGGIDVIYPDENTDLYNQIKEGGLIIAESPLSQKPFAQSFPRRNRIVSGLSNGIIVVEANMRSGSLITARLAGEQGRDIYAVPGAPYDPRAAGTNHLIREGASLVRDKNDVLEMLMNFSGTTLRKQKPLPLPKENNNKIKEIEQEKIEPSKANSILEHLSFTPLGVDELIRACQLSVPEVQNALLEFELSGRITRHAGNKVSLRKEN